MPPSPLRLVPLLILTILSAGGAWSRRDLSFEERVAAQEAIERVYYSHQIGATKPFEETVPRDVLEQKVQTEIQKEAELLKLRNVSISDEMIEKEFERITRDSLLPDRLSEIEAALANDPFLIRECFVRPVLVNRFLARHLTSETVARTSSRMRPLVQGDGSLAAEVAVVEPRDPKAPGSDLEQALEEEACAPDDIWDNGSLDPGGTPAASSDYTSVWTGSFLIVWGGGYSGSNPGWKYDPVADSWATLSVVGSPVARTDPVAVWTGDTMLVWGGRAPNSPHTLLQDGGKYDPTADTWAPTSLVNAPAARAEFTAVWTGIEMIVWGGRDDTSPTGLDTGGRYNPETDTWSPTFSFPPVPAGRWGHTAVWTGSRMVIWGGIWWVPGVGPEYTKSGARYDPASDSWQSTAQPVGSAERANHTAVWTGSRMIVWGGYRETAVPPFLSGGMQYNPVADTWSAIAFSGAPAGRSLHTAVWTGRQMIVWGGVVNINNVTTNTGGRYDLATNTWVSLSTIGAPASRWGHVAAWTGERMIVWGGLGGIAGTTPLSSGGRYVVDTLRDLDDDGFAACEGDCNDAEPAMHPGGSEICDGLDNDCNDTTDDRDLDGDGSFGCGADCNDLDPSIHPGGTEICNFIDDDCDGATDEGFPDQDSDGVAACHGDCNDLDPSIHPGRAEVCNGIDDNCSGQRDEGFQDLDADGYAFCMDCNESDPGIHPGAAETCDAADNDCDALVDEGFDLDADGVSTCMLDCNDADPTAWDLPLDVLNLEPISFAPLTWSWLDEGQYIGPGVIYDVPGGTMGPGTGISVASAVCLGSPTTAEFTDTRPHPSLGTGYWYLFRARNSCGTGSYGQDGLGGERSVTACP